MEEERPAASVTVTESGNGPYGQIVLAGHHVGGADEPERLGGHDTGMAPYEYLLAALGACTSMTLRLYADHHGWKLARISVALRHVVEPTPMSPVDRFERRITLSGELTTEQRQRLLEVAERCPVSRTLARGSRIAAVLGS